MKKVKKRLDIHLIIPYNPMINTKEYTMKSLNINLKPNENLYVTTYEDGNVEYIPSTPEDNEIEEKRLRSLGVKFTTEIRNDLVREFDF